MSIIRNGRGGMIEQPKERAFVQGQGWTYSRVWIGPKTSADGLANQLIDAGYNVSISTTPANAIVRAIYGGNDDAGIEQPIDRWEVVVNQDQTDILDSNFAANLTDDEIVAIDAWRKNSDEYKTPPTLTTADGAAIFRLVKRKVEYAPIEKSVIRLTRSASRRVAKSIRLSNVGKLFTTAKMVELENAPQELLEEYTGSIPARLQELGVRYGYVKHKPSMYELPNGKWQMTIEWEAGLWPEFLYPSV